MSIRDRENSTVFVADLPANTTEQDLKELFKDVRRFSSYYNVFLTGHKCGLIREVKVTQLAGTVVATVEFNDRVRLSQLQVCSHTKACL
jgi:squamous cell carcinoma antigen recognized by T-cells 3